jgi:hypothetical protein
MPKPVEVAEIMVNITVKTMANTMVVVVAVAISIRVIAATVAIRPLVAANTKSFLTLPCNRPRNNFCW